MSALRFQRVKRLPLPARFVAITTPWGVCYYRGELTDALRRHEVTHWAQYRRHGRAWFLVLYAVETLRRGYRNNRFEIEARGNE